MGLRPMKREDQLLTLFTRQKMAEDQRLQAARIIEQEEVQWEIVYETAVQHGVAPLLFTNLTQFFSDYKQLQWPAEIEERFKLRTMEAIAINGSQAQWLRQVWRFFADLAVEIMLIKGSAVEILVYDQPWYTTANDIDIIIKRKREQFQAGDIARLEELTDAFPLEYDFYEHHDVTINGVLPVDFKAIWQDSGLIKHGEFEFAIMSPEDGLIALCINSCRKRYFRLKNIFDIAETIRHYPALDWSIVEEKARQWQCRHIVYTALLVCRLAVGCEVPDSFLPALKISPLRAKVINGLVAQTLSSRPFTGYSGNRLGQRTIDRSVILPYFTYEGSQLLGKIKNSGGR